MQKAFYISILIPILRPASNSSTSSLRNKPIGVTAQNGRTCIIAASREAKKLGIKSPSRTFDALRIVPEMIFVPAHFEKYWEITQKFLDICKDFSPYVELFSLDEVFMDITSTQNLFGGKYPLITKSKSVLKRKSENILRFRWEFPIISYWQNWRRELINRMEPRNYAAKHLGNLWKGSADRFLRHRQKNRKKTE